MYYTLYKRLPLLISALALLALVTPSPSFAQLPGGGPLTLTVIPTSPKPGQMVTVRVSSTNIDLTRTFITWHVNGQVSAQGSSVQETTFTAGPSGSSAAVSVSVASDFGFFSAQTLVRPASINILWESNSYTPPFYRGKALPGHDASITMVALPEVISSFGRRIPTRELVFDWQRNGRPLVVESGQGKNTISLTGPVLGGSDEIVLTVSTLDGTFTARRFLTLPSAAPEIVFYEQSPTLGMRFEEALEDGFVLQNEEIAVAAHPFYFGTPSRSDSSLEYRWTVNGSRTETPSDKSVLVLRQTGGGSGAATISLTIENISSVLERVRNTFSMTFGGS